MRVAIITALFFHHIGFAEIPAKLSETGLYADFATKTVASSNQPYAPQYPLWTDGASKRRWLFLPEGTSIRTLPGEQTPVGRMVDMDHWEFPVGTKLWKEFSFPKTEGFKRVETRLMQKISPTKWEFASYVWNEDESEALLAPAQGIKDVYPTAFGTKHDIPSAPTCLRCHNRGGDPVNGVDALQLSADRDPNALHAEPILSNYLTTEWLAQNQKLIPAPNMLSPRIHARDGVGRAAMGYLHANCGSCHNPEGTANYTELLFRHSVSSLEEASAPSFLTSFNQVTTGFQIPGQEETFRLLPGNPEKSAIHFRMGASIPFQRMPPVGAEVNDSQAIELIRQWIQGLGSTS